MVGRPRTTVLACALAAVLAGCGSGDDATIPKDEGENLVTTLDAIESSLTTNNCGLIGDQVASFANQVAALPDDVDPEVKKGLVDGADRLIELSDDPEQCGDVTGTTGPTGTETPSTTETETETTSTSTSTTSSSTTTSSTTDEDPPEQDEDDEGDGPPVEVPGGDDGGSGGRGESATDSGGLEGGKRR